MIEVSQSRFGDFIRKWCHIVGDSDQRFRVFRNDVSHTGEKGEKQMGGSHIIRLRHLFIAAHLFFPFNPHDGARHSAANEVSERNLFLARARIMSRRNLLLASARSERAESPTIFSPHNMFLRRLEASPSNLLTFNLLTINP